MLACTGFSGKEKEPTLLLFAKFHGVSTTSMVNFKGSTAATMIENFHHTDTININKFNSIDNSKV